MEAAGVYDGVDEQEGHLSETELKILALMQDTPIRTGDILNHFRYAVVTRNIRNALNKLLKLQLIAYTIPDKPRSKNQQYRITALGKSARKQH